VNLQREQLVLVLFDELPETGRPHLRLLQVVPSGGDLIDSPFVDDNVGLLLNDLDERAEARIVDWFARTILELFLDRLDLSLGGSFGAAVACNNFGGNDVGAY
jgi:hypothetical protein